MSVALEFTEAADDDLASLHAWITSRAGAEIADRYEDRLIDRIRKLLSFPGQGSRYDSIRPGLRGVTHEKRLLILYVTEGDVVRIVRIIGAMRDYGSLSIV